jgi:hypothetical protein
MPQKESEGEPPPDDVTRRVRCYATLIVGHVLPAPRLSKPKLSFISTSLRPGGRPARAGHRLNFPLGL